ncbi:Guanine nucleotide-binding protein, beta subunit [Trema orientale]|uniref:WD repeat-containing protein 76 n=1 Tax=Trema orientale TaxID=63057 RepID=A0A2P5AKX0_TREOI|nr:Guanine nucleotide-binding protein, beta subunit [Trema orientale]
MAPKKLNEYERKRLENIRRNDEMMASLKLQSMATRLSAASIKRQRSAPKPKRISPKKKPKNDNLVVVRRSLRTRGILPDSEGLDNDLVESPAKSPNSQTPPSKPSIPKMGPLSMSQAFLDEGSDRALIETILSIGKKSELGVDLGAETDGVRVCKEENLGVLRNSIKKEENEVGGSFSLYSMTLNPENVARVVQDRIMTLRFFPCSNSRIVVAGSKGGDVGFWNLDHQMEEEDGVYRYHTHSGPISGISIHRHCLSKVFTCCYDGYIRSMDVEKEIFDLIYSSDNTIYSFSQRSDDMKCLYFGEGRGDLNIWDERTGNCATQWTLHEDRINSIDFSSENPNIMATSSSDSTACIWDLRSIDADKPKPLKTVSHKRAVYSAYFSPSGKFLATTSFDDTVRVLSGDNFEETSWIPHNNQTGRWISPFKAIWGWDDSHIFIGNMKRGVDVISPAQRKTIFTLQSPHISAIPCRFDTHPYNVGMLAGATGGGQVYMWTGS